MYASVVTAGVEDEMNRLRRELEATRLRVEVDRAQQSQIQQELRERIVELEERESERKCVICLENPKVHSRSDSSGNSSTS